MQLFAIVVIAFRAVEAQHFLRELPKLVVARCEVKPVHQQIAESPRVRATTDADESVRDCSRREALFHTPRDQ